MAFLKSDSPIPRSGKGKKLTPKMEAFVDYYMASGEAAKAVLKAGYKTQFASRIATQLLNHPLVIAEIDRRKTQRREKLELSAEYVINKLVEIVEETDKSNPQAALRGLELLGKHLGLYKERQEITGANGNPIEYEQRIREDSAALESAIARLAGPSREGNVVKLPNV